MRGDEASAQELRTTRGAIVCERLADGNPTAIGEHARRNVHCHQLLEEQLGSIWQVNLRNARAIFAWTAFKCLVFEIARRL